MAAIYSGTGDHLTACDISGECTLELSGAATIGLHIAHRAHIPRGKALQDVAHLDLPLATAKS